MLYRTVLVFFYSINQTLTLLLGISVVLDLTPNYKGEKPWFTNDRIDDVAVQVKVCA